VHDLDFPWIGPRDGFEDNMVEAKAKAKARGLRDQGKDQGSSRPRPRPEVFEVET